MTTESNTSSIGMSAEAGYGAVETAPLRISGFLALILGLLSVLSLLGPALLVIPILTLFFGFFALRKYDGPVPVGVRPAIIGLVLAAGFGACGFFLPWMKTMTLGSQAEYFARQYLEVVARGELELAMELKKNYANRYMHNMSLKQHYEMTEGAQSCARFVPPGIGQSYDPGIGAWSDLGIGSADARVSPVSSRPCRCRVGEL